MDNDRTTQEGLDKHRQNLDLEEGNRMYSFLILVALVRKPRSRNHVERTNVFERMRKGKSILLEK